MEKKPDKTNKVATRHTAIKELIATHAIEDQDTLVDLIKKTYGIDCNQSIISRDLRQLNVATKMIDDRMVYDINTLDVSQEIFRLAVLNVRHNESLIVIDTLPSLAGFVGDMIDLTHKDTILGCIAGENTV